MEIKDKEIIVRQIEEAHRNNLLSMEPGDSIEIEKASDWAKRLAAKQASLISAARSIDGDKYAPDRTMIMNLKLRRDHGRKINMITPIDSENNLGTNGFSFESYLFEDKPPIGLRLGPIKLTRVKEILGVDTSSYVAVDIHTDQETMSEIEQMKERSSVQINEKAFYYFDGEGNYAKVVELPKSLQDDRSVLHELGDSIYVASEMSELDFRLAEFALDNFNHQISMSV